MSGNMWHRLRHDDEGVSIVEVMVAAFLVAVALAAVASTATATMLSVSSSRLRQQAIAAATSSIETARTYPYDELATRPADPTGTAAVDLDGPGPMASEPRVVSPTGRVTGAVHHGSADGLTWVTSVTWFDDPSTTTTTQDAKRVTARVTWQVGDRSFEVQQSTIISSVARTASP